MRVAAYRLQRVGRWGRKSALLDATTTDISRLARIKINNLCPSHFNACNTSCLPKPPLIDGEEMPHLQRTSAPSAEETCPEFGGASDKLPRFWQN